jgi:hypothetical protein
MNYALDIAQPANPLPSPDSYYERRVDSTDFAFSSAIQTRFAQLAIAWKRQTGMFSVTQQKVIHEHYLEIIGMSWSVVPYLIRDMQKGASHWFPALRAIAGEARPNDKNASNFEEAVKIWTDWWNDRQNATRYTFPARISFPKAA